MRERVQLLISSIGWLVIAPLYLIVGLAALAFLLLAGIGATPFAMYEWATKPSHVHGEFESHPIYMLLEWLLPEKK